MADLEATVKEHKPLYRQRIGKTFGKPVLAMVVENTRSEVEYTEQQESQSKMPT